MRLTANKWDEAGAEGRAMLLYAPETYPNIADAADLMVTLLYVLRASPADDWSDEDTLRVLAEGWPDEDAAELRAFIAAEPRAFADYFAAANAAADELVD
jgi:hypothetical protein